MKKLISVLLTVCMVLSVMTIGFINVYAEEGEVEEENPCEEVGQGVYNKETFTLSFPENAVIPDFAVSKDSSGKEVVDYPWWNKPYTSVVFGEGISAIGANAFAYSSKLEKIDIPESVVILGKGAFYGCSALESAEVKAATDISEEMFAECAALKSVILSGSPETIGNKAFYNCTSLSEINIPEGVTMISDDAFSHCTGLEKAVISDSVKTISKYSFYGCENLKTLELGKGIEKIDDDAFAGCSKLESLELPSSLKDISSNAFNGCSSLTSLILPEDFSAAIGSGAFDLCTSLKSVTIGPKVTSIGAKAFGFGRKGGKISGFTITGYENTEAQKYAKSNGFTFISLGNYLDGKCGENVTWSFDEANGVLTISGSGAMNDYTADKLPAYSRFADKIKEIVIDDKITKIGAYAFYNMSVSGMFIPEAVEEIGENAIGNYVDGVLAEGFGIKGYAGSAADDYAVANKIDFDAIIPDFDKVIEKNLKAKIDSNKKIIVLCQTEVTKEMLVEKLAKSGYKDVTISNDAIGTGVTLSVKLGEEAVSFMFIVPGDTNGDGVVNSGDALQILQHSVGSVELENENMTAGDINGDGVINSSDALDVLQVSVGQIEIGSYLK